MRRTYIDRLGKYYQHKEEDTDEFFSGFEWAMNGFRYKHEHSLGNQHGFPRKRLLVVDDEASIRDTYIRLFSYRGYEVLSAANAVEAREILLKEKVDLVFLDLNMPEVDGETLFQLARTFHKGVKIIVSSVYPIEEQRERIKDADGYFDKSDARAILLRMVATLA